MKVFMGVIAIVIGIVFLAAAGVGCAFAFSRGGPHVDLPARAWRSCRIQLTFIAAFGITRPGAATNQASMHLFSVRPLLFAAILAAISGSSSSVLAWMSAPVLNSANGHYYAFFTGASGEKFSPPAMTFDDALSRAAAMSHLGIPGHLVTITSPAEQDFVYQSYKSLIGAPRIPSTPFTTEERFWIGTNDAAVEGEWRWVVGPEAGQLIWLGKENGSAHGYHNWRKDHFGTLIEPNDQPHPFDPAGEDFGSLILSTVPYYGPYFWNDVSTNDDYPGLGFVPRLAIVEFSTIPEPSTAALFSVATIAIAVTRQVRRR